MIDPLQYVFFFLSHSFVFFLSRTSKQRSIEMAIKWIIIFYRRTLYILRDIRTASVRSIAMTIKLLYSIGEYHILNTR
jgi:hypothetical protein